MKRIWVYKQALFLNLLNIKDYELFYDEKDVIEIKKILDVFSELSDVTKRELLIDTKMQYEN